MTIRDLVEKRVKVDAKERIQGRKASGGAGAQFTYTNFIRGVNQQTSSGGDIYNNQIVYRKSGTLITINNPVGLINLNGDATITEVYAHNCPSLTTLNVFSDANLTILEVKGCTALTALDAHSSTSLVTVLLDSQVSASCTYDFSSCTSLTRFSAPLITSCNALNLTAANLNFVNVPILSVAQNIAIQGTKLTSLSFPSLTSAANLQFANNSLLTSLSLPLAVSCAGVIQFQTCPLLTSVNFNSFASPGTLLQFNACTSLVSLSFPALVGYFGGVTGNAATAFTTMTVNNLITNKTYNFTGDALNVAMVNLVLAKGVAGGMTTGNITLNAGTNAAPTGQGLTDKATLQAAGVTVATN